MYADLKVLGFFIFFNNKYVWLRLVDFEDFHFLSLSKNYLLKTEKMKIFLIDQI